MRRAAPSTARGLVRPPRARPRPAPRARGLGGYSADGSDAARLPGGDPGPAVGALAPLLQPRLGLPARAHTRLLCRGRRAYELANHAVSARSRARGSSSTSRRGRSCAPHRASVECRAPQTFRHRVECEWCGGAEPVESEHRAETRVYNTCFQTQLKTCDRSGNWPLAPRAAAAPWLVTGSGATYFAKKAVRETQDSGSQHEHTLLVHAAGAAAHRRQLLVLLPPPAARCAARTSAIARAARRASLVCTVAADRRAARCRLTTPRRASISAPAEALRRVHRAARCRCGAGCGACD